MNDKSIFDRLIYSPLRVEIEKLCAITVEGGGKSIGTLINETERICRGDKASASHKNLPYDIISFDEEITPPKIIVCVI